ncbi:MAG TPA: alpha/beta hydrolase [Solirubrobacteraceae bacterium]|jgi:alpha-beta hydrolase superfamily lysophospholipase|nr:alpha/beta hydrolase [Solirubrobacteraceae bacterium]
MIAVVRRRMRTIDPVLPTEVASAAGLAYSVWLPPPGVPPRGGVVVLHGAGSCKENHYDFVRGALAARFAALAFDQRGHGESNGALDGRALEDVASMAGLLRTRSELPELPVAVRGSSLGGYLAIVAAREAGAQAVIAICPASAEGLRRGLTSGRFGFPVDVPALERILSEHDEFAAIQLLDVPVLLLHAEGDEQVPVQHSRELAERMTSSRSRLIAVPGGHHRSVQHDPELQAVSLRFLQRVLDPG